MPGNAATLAPWTVPSWQYGEFLNQIFDIWVRRDVDRITICADVCDVALAAFGRLLAAGTVWLHSETCGHAFAFESGGVYSTATTLSTGHLLGSIHQHSIEAANNSERAVRLAKPSGNPDRRLSSL